VRVTLKRSGLDVPALAAAAAHLAADAEALAWAAERAWSGRVEADGAALLLDVSGLPAALTQRLLARAVTTLGGTPRGGGVSRLAARLGAGQAGTLAGVQARPLRGRPGLWRLTAAPPPRSVAKMA
jgi:tRNA(Ile)-lysidine synthase